MPNNLSPYETSLLLNMVKAYKSKCSYYSVLYDILSELENKLNEANEQIVDTV